MAILSGILAVLLMLLACRRLLLIGGSIFRRRESAAPLHTPSVVILISARDEQQIIPVLLQALDRLDYPADRVSFNLISDGSVDQTPRLMTNWALTRTNARVHVLERSAGKSSALRIGLESAPNSDLVVTFDADTVPHPAFLRQLAAPFADPRVGAAGGLCSVSNPVVNVISRYAALENWVHFLVNLSGKDRWNWGPIPSGGAAAYRRDALEAAGGFLPGVADDVPTAVRLIAAGYRTRFVRTAIVDTEVVTSMQGLIRQRRRWSAGLMSAASSARGLETMLVAAGYADRIVFAAAAVLSAMGYLPLAIPISYLAVIIATAMTAVARAGHAGRMHEFLGVAFLMAPVELWMSVRGLSRRAIPAWKPHGRTVQSISKTQ